MELEVLLREYEFSRLDDRHSENSIVGLLAVLLALAGIFIALISKSCTALHTLRVSPCLRVSNWVWATAPLAPMTVAAYITQIAASTLLRRYYMKAIERRLIEIADVHASLDPLLFRQGRPYRQEMDRLVDDSGEAILIPTTTHFIQVITSPTRAHPTYRALNYFLYGSLLASVVLLSFFSLYQISRIEIRSALMLVYFVAMSLILLGLYKSTAGRRNVWRTARDELRARLASPLYGPPR